MDNTFYFAVIGVVVIFHLPLAFFTSKEIIDYPLWSKPRKLNWLLFAWLVPFKGFKITHKKLKLKIKGGGTGGEDTYTCGGE